MRVGGGGDVTLQNTHTDAYRKLQLMLTSLSSTTPLLPASPYYTPLLPSPPLPFTLVIHPHHLLPGNWSMVLPSPTSFPHTHTSLNTHTHLPLPSHSHPYCSLHLTFIPLPSSHSHFKKNTELFKHQLSHPHTIPIQVTSDLTTHTHTMVSTYAKHHPALHTHNFISLSQTPTSP